MASNGKRKKTFGAEPDAPPKGIPAARLATLALVLFAIGGATALAISLRSPEAKAATSTTTTAAAKAEHKPWEYDPVGNRHWNAEPGHNHWHPGPPPPPPEAVGGTQMAAQVLGTPVNMGNGTLGPVSLSPGAAAPLVPPVPGPATGQVVPPPQARQPGDPDPWFYDSNTDQYWSPTHRHWHKGKPPPPGQR